MLCSLDFDILKSNLQVPIYLSVVRMLVISCSSLSLLLCWVYVALKASVMSRLQWSSLLLCAVTPIVSSSKQKKVCLTWFFPTVTAQGLRRAKEYARLGLQSATLQLEIDHMKVASCHMGEP